MLALVLLAAVKLLPETTDIQYRQPQVAFKSDTLGVTFGAGNAIYYTYSTNDGQTFTRPVRIAAGGQLELGRHRGPRLAYQSGNAVISAIVSSKGGGDLLVWRSPDHGKTWLGPLRVNDQPGSARPGLHAMASGNGMVVVVWLDERQPGARLYGAKSMDGGATWSANRLIYESPEGSICEGCHPSVLVGPSGFIHVMFRNRLAGARDPYVTTSRDGGETWEPARKLGKGSWHVDACPMDGGGLAVSASNKLYAVWRRENKIFVASTTGIESELGEGRDPAIASGLNDALYAVWVAEDGIKMRTSIKDQVRTLSPKGASPQVVFTGRVALALWEQDDGIAIGIVD